MNPFTMVVAIVVIIGLATIARALITGRGSASSARAFEARLSALETRIAALEERQPAQAESAGS